MLDSFPMKEHVLVKVRTKEFAGETIKKCQYEKT